MKEKTQEPIIGIGTVLQLDNGEYEVYHIGAKRGVDERGNPTIQPLVAARQHTKPGFSKSIVFTGAELEEALA